MSVLKIFVSHSHADNAFCQAFISQLRSADVDIWYDEHNLGSGQLGDVISNELQNRPVFIVILSPDAFQSQWVLDEAKWAFNLYRRKPERIIVPVTAAPIKKDYFDNWLFLEDFKRIEGTGLQPLTASEAAQRVMHALALTSTNPSITAQNADSIDELLVQCNALFAQKRFMEALDVAERVISINPNYNLAWNTKGLILSALNRDEEALASFDIALTFQPQLAISWNNKGASLDSLGRYYDALVAFDNALAIDPQLVTAWSGKGITLTMFSRNQEALTAQEPGSFDCHRARPNY